MKAAWRTLLLSLVVGCGASVSPIDVPLAGHYSIVTYGGSSLPVLLAVRMNLLMPTYTCQVLLADQQLDFSSGGAARQLTMQRIVCPDTNIVQIDTVEGTVQQNGQAITIQFAGTAHNEAATVSATLSQMQLTIYRSTTPPKTDATIRVFVAGVP